MTTSKILVDEYFKGKTILDKKPNERTLEDLDFLQTWLQEKSKLFESLDRDGLCEITKQVTLQVIHTGQLVYQQEDCVENFYVILRGSVSLFHDPMSRHLKQMAAQTASLINDQVPQMLATGGHPRKMIVMPTKADRTTCRSRVCGSNNMGVEVEKLAAGDYFGEEALLQKDDTSSLYAIANEYVEVLVICAELFEETLLAHFEKDLYEKALFLANMDLFANCSPYLIRRLALSMKERRFMNGECLFRQDMPFSHIFLLKSGSVKLSASSKCKAPQELVDQIEPPMDHLSEILDEAKPMYCKRSRSVSSRESSVYSQRSLSNTTQLRAKLPQRSVSVPPMIMSGTNTRHRPIKHKRRHTTETLRQSTFMGFRLHPPKRSATVEFCSIGPKGMLNHIEAICKVNHSVFNAVSSSDTVVYEINAFTFIQLLEKKIPRTLYYIITMITERVEAWTPRYSCIQVFKPLIEILQQRKKKLETDRAFKEGRKKSAYTPEKLAYSAVRDLGKNLLTLNKKSSSLKKDETCFDSPLPRNTLVHSDSEDLCQPLASMCSTGEPRPCSNSYSQSETSRDIENPSPFNAFQLPPRCISTSTYLRFKESSKVVQIDKDVSLAHSYSSAKRKSSRTAISDEVIVTDNLENVEYVAHNVSTTKNSSTDPKELDKTIPFNHKQYFDMKLNEMTMPKEYSRLCGFDQPKELHEQTIPPFELTISGKHCLLALGLRNTEPIKRSFEDAISPAKSAKTTSQKEQRIPYRYSMTPYGHPIATKKAMSHVPLRKKTKKGDLDNVVWSGVPARHQPGNSVRKGAWISQQTQQRVTQPRPPVNLAPSTLRPYYV